MPWYYIDLGKQVGPVSDEAFQRLQQEGRLTPATMVWQQGMADWQPLSALTAGAVAAPTGDMVSCAMCGRSFPPAQVIQYGENAVCAECKPLFFQKVKEGAATVGFHYAGFWIRFVAKFVDGLILGLVNGVMGIVAGLAMARAFQTEQSTYAALGLQGVLYIFQIAVGCAYNAFFVAKYAATPGKMACGIKVVMADGSPVSTRRAIGRYFAEMLSSLILGIGYLMAAFDDEKRSLHDRICGTRVIRK